MECEGVRVCTLWSSICMRMCWLFENLPHDTSHTSSSFRLVSIATTAWASLTAEEAPSKRGERDCRREERAFTLCGGGERGGTRGKGGEVRGEKRGVRGEGGEG